MCLSEWGSKAETLAPQVLLERFFGVRRASPLFFFFLASSKQKENRKAAIHRRFSVFLMVSVMPMFDGWLSECRLAKVWPGQVSTGTPIQHAPRGEDWRAS
jgi:hypothetical protein